VQVVATAGHVDHGKSTLVRALTGMEPDRWALERARGMTLDLGFAWTTLPTGDTVAFVDVPGHERFVATMLAGVGPVPSVLLVVAADEGWMPQTAEHVDALLALGVRDGILVITRGDLMEPELALHDAREHLAGTPLAALPSVCVSARTGAGLDDLRAALHTLTTGLPIADDAADVRLWIDRAFTIRGSGTVVTGTLGAGTVQVEDDLELRTPTGVRAVRVRALESLGEQVGTVRGVSRVGLNLRGLPRDAVDRGDALLTPGAWLGSEVLDVVLHGVRDTTADSRSLPTSMTLHIGSAAVLVRVRPLGPDTARLQLRRPLPLRITDRAVLRDPGRRRVAAGVTVLDVRPPPLRRRGAAAQRGDELARMTETPRAAAELKRRGVVRQRELAAMGLPTADLEALVQAGVPAEAGWLIDPERAARAAEALADAVAAHDAVDPLDPGLSTMAACRAAGLPEAKLLAAVLRYAERTSAATGLVLRDGRVTRSVALSVPAPLQLALSTLRHDLERAPFAAPAASRLAELGLGSREIASLIRAGELLPVADGVVLLPGADARAVTILAGLGTDFTVSEARQALGTSRRVTVPLLELLARNGHTVRTAEGRHRLI
jgi:selenocysteine-specific elongation factor